MSFRETLRSEMKFQNLTTKELAAKSGVSINTLNMYLSSKNSQPSIYIAAKIAKALNITLDKLAETEKIGQQKEKILGADFSDMQVAEYSKPFEKVQIETKDKTKSENLVQSIIENLEGMTPAQLEAFAEITQAYIKGIHS